MAAGALIAIGHRMTLNEIGLLSGIFDVPEEQSPLPQPDKVNEE